MSSRTINRLKKNRENPDRITRKYTRAIKEFSEAVDNYPVYSKKQLEQAHLGGIQYALDYTYTDDYPGFSRDQMEGYEMCRDLIWEAVRDATR